MGLGLTFFLTFQKFLLVSIFAIVYSNHGIRLGHCAPSPCRNLGLKQFLTHGGIRDTSEKNPNHKKWVGYEGDKVFSCTNFKTQNQFLLK